MDQVYVEAPVAAGRSMPLEREFYAEFPRVLNYVARLTDDVEQAPGIACEAFRQVIQRSGAGGGGSIARADVFRVATELSRQALQPRRWFRRRRTFSLVLEGFPQVEDRKALRRDTVQRALTALPFEARAVVLLRDHVKLSYEELGDILGAPPKKLVHVLDRARAEFSEIYDYIKF